MADTVCSCATFYNVAIPEHRNHPCARVITKGWTLCRPCALNWHDEPCDAYVRESMFHLVQTCARCGHDSALHRPRDENEPPRTREAMSDRERINAVFGLSG